MMRAIVGGIASLFGFSVSPLLSGALIAGALAIGVGMIWANGYSAASRRCEVAALKSQLAATKTDLKATQDAAQAAIAARAESEAAARDAEERIAKYAEELKARSAGACALTADDIRRVRGRAGTRTR